MKCFRNISLFVFALILLVGCGYFDIEENVVLIDKTHVSSNYRMAAEWEPTIGSIIAWPLVIPKELVMELPKGEMILYVMVSNEIERYKAEDQFKEWGVNIDNVRFVVTAQGLAWAWPRDWGPFAVYSDDGKYSLADPIFISYPEAGPKGYDGKMDADIYPKKNYIPDDLASASLAKALSVDIFPVNAALTGGNFLVDGLGTAFSTCTIQWENHTIGISDQKLFKIINEKLGIKKHIILPNYEKKGIQHIDCALKPLDEETLLVMRLPKDHYEYDIIEEMVKQLKKETNGYGRPYKIVRIDTARYKDEEVAAYTNSLILNKKIFVPLYNIPQDKEAIKTWQKVMPGYEVIGFTNNISLPVWDYTGWQGFDALHCRVRAVWDSQMIRMSHKRINNIVEPAKSFPIEVFIKDYSKAGLIADKLRLYFKTNTNQNWQTVLLSSTEAPNIFKASISGINSGETVKYYISAADNSGRKETLPRTAPDNFYSFLVK